MMLMKTSSDYAFIISHNQNDCKRNMLDFQYFSRIFQGKVGVLGVLGVSVEWQHLLLPLDCGL
jgi:hypothetical protein